MDSQKVQKVKEEHKKCLIASHQKIMQWNKFKEDYEALKVCLETLPDKIVHDVMVPFGSQAFMPGQLVHTNNITVLLGDNWFAEVSAKQAAQILERRLTQCEKMLEDLEKEKEQYENWLGYIADVYDGDLVEIIEEYDPEKEQLWREQHATNVRAYRKQLAEEKENSKSSEKNSVEEKSVLKSDDYYSNKLRDLETKEISESSEHSEDISETEEGETEEEVANDNEIEIDSNKTNQINETEANIDKEPHGSSDKHVRWKDLTHARTKQITFTHSKKKPKGPPISFSEESELDNKPVIQSPSDIYKCFSFATQPLKPKSILKNGSSCKISDSSLESMELLSLDNAVNETTPNDTPDLQKTSLEFHDKKSKENLAFTAEVYEHQNKKNNFHEANSTSNSRPVSHFKSSRRNGRKSTEKTELK